MVDELTRALFLDFDGTLHPAGGPAGQCLPFEWLPELASVLSGYPDVRIVVHSSWSERFSDDDLREFLSELASERVEVARGATKSQAIAAYLEAHPDVVDWAILDDEPFEFARVQRSRLISCDPRLGISETEALTRLRRWLTGQGLE